MRTMSTTSQRNSSTDISARCVYRFITSAYWTFWVGNCNSVAYWTAEVFPTNPLLISSFPQTGIHFQGVWCSQSMWRTMAQEYQLCLTNVSVADDPSSRNTIVSYCRMPTWSVLGVIRGIWFCSLQMHRFFYSMNRGCFSYDYCTNIRLLRWSFNPAASSWSHSCFTVIPKRINIFNQSALGTEAFPIFFRSIFSKFSGLPKRLRRSFITAATESVRTNRLLTASSASPWCQLSCSRFK